MRLDSTLKLVTGMVTIVVGLTAAIPYWLDVRMSAVNQEIADLSKRAHYYTTLLEMLRDAETGQRGYVITGDEAYLQPYHAAIGLIPSLRAQVREHTSNREESEAFRQIEAAIDLKLGELAETVALRRSSDFHTVLPIVVAGKGKTQMDLLRNMIGEQISEHNAQRDELNGQLVANAHFASRVSIGAGIANILALSTVLFIAHITLRKRHRAEVAAREARTALEQRSQQVQHQNEQLAGSAQLMHALDMAQTLDEASEIISAYFSWLLPETSGSLYLYRNSRDQLERKASWGDDLAEAENLEPVECWGLRSGKPHFSEGGKGLHCKHVAQSEVERSRLCLPLVTQGEVIGMLTVLGALLEGSTDKIEREWVERLSDQVALSLNNVQLRLSLRRLSVVDPLTELYNRRYMDESLKRELARAARSGKPVAVVLVDLDHFKRVNDTFGHEAGDGLLREVGRLLRDSIRKCDIACRYGGEELVLILPECELETAARRAEGVRQAIAALMFTHRGQLVSASASFGVATSTEVMGADGEALLAAADHALYDAKRSGRNRVCRYVAEGGTPAAPLTAGAPANVEADRVQESAAALRV
jgi:diguanylate cyclase (GGDEF)-like protein